MEMRANSCPTYFAIITFWVVLFHLTPLQSSAELSLNSKITVETGSGYPPQEFSYDISQCNSLENDVPSGIVTEIRTNGMCVNIYPTRDCSGWFIRFIPYSSYYDDHMSTFGYKWEMDKLMQERFLVKSVGPCYYQCDSRNWLGARPIPTRVTFYTAENFTGHESSLVLEDNNCHLVPFSGRRLYGIRSIKIDGDEMACIELHDAPNCGGIFTQFRPGYPSLNDLWEWSLGYDKVSSSNAHSPDAKSVRRCGNACKSIVPEFNPIINHTGLGENVVTFYSDFGYYGHHKHFNLSGGCVNVSQTSSVEYLSLRTYGKCVIMYATENCLEEPGTYPLQTSGKDKEYYMQKLTALTIPVPAKSMQLCPNSDNVSPTERMETVHQTITESSLPTWIVVYMCISTVFAVIISPICGACCYKKIANRNPKSTIFDPNVQYKPE